MAFVVAVFVGCGEKNKAEVYFLNFKPESAEVYKEIAKKYEQETGVSVKVVTAAANTYEQTLKSEIAKSSAPTIFQINGPIGYESWKDYCLNIENSDFANLLSDDTLAIRDQNGNGVYAVPYVVEGYGIIYNDEIMKRYFALDDKAVNIKSADEIIFAGRHCVILCRFGVWDGDFIVPSCDQDDDLTAGFLLHRIIPVRV